MATDMVAYGVYPDRESFERALEALRSAGFRNSDVSAILPDRDRTARDLAHEINTKTPEGIATGAGAGAALGGVLGWLVGIGAIAIPGIGPLVAAGPVVAALAGAGAAGATGGLVGGLIGAGIPEVEAKRFAGRIRDGAYLISPVLYRDLLYVCKNNGVFNVFDAKTGDRVYQQRLGSGTTAFTASIVAADGKLYFTTEEGDVYVVRAGRTYELLSQNPLGGVTMATPAVSEGTLYFRTSEKILAIK